MSTSTRIQDGITTLDQDSLLHQDQFYDEHNENGTHKAGSIEESYLSASVQSKLNAGDFLNNTTAVSDPTVDDDSGDGYEAGSFWINTASDEIFRCLNATVGSAVWVKTSLTIDELGSAAVEDVTTIAQAERVLKLDADARATVAKLVTGEITLNSETITNIDDSGEGLQDFDSHIPTSKTVKSVTDLKANSADVVPNTRTVTAGTGLTGGGALSGDITINANVGTTSGTLCAGDDSRVTSAYAHSTTTSGNPHSVTASDTGALPLTGGTLSGNLNVDAAVIYADSFNTASSSVSHSVSNGTIVWGYDSTALTPSMSNAQDLGKSGQYWGSLHVNNIYTKGAVDIDTNLSFNGGATVNGIETTFAGGSTKLATSSAISSYLSSNYATTGSLSSHTGNTSNPHGVTAAQSDSVSATSGGTFNGNVTVSSSTLEVNSSINALFYLTCGSTDNYTSQIYFGPNGNESESFIRYTQVGGYSLWYADGGSVFLSADRLAPLGAGLALGGSGASNQFSESHIIDGYFYGNVDIDGNLTFDGAGASISSFQTTISDTDTAVPTSGAVVDYVPTKVTKEQLDANGDIEDEAAGMTDDDNKIPTCAAVIAYGDANWGGSTPSYEDYFYLAAGNTGSNTNAHRQYSISGDSWASMTNYSISVRQLANSRVSGNMYVGHNGYTTSFQGGVYEYDMDANSYATGTSRTAMYSPGYAPCGYEAYSFGGVTSGGNTNQHQKYTIAGGSWSTLTTYPTSNGYSSSGTDEGNNQIYSGGNDSGSTAWRVWDVVATGFTTLTSATNNMTRADGCWYSGKVYTTENDTSTYVSIYTIVGGTWSRTASGCHGAYMTSLTSHLNGDIGKVGGANSGNQNGNSIYSISGDSWSTGTVYPVATYGMAGM